MGLIISGVCYGSDLEQDIGYFLVRIPGEDNEITQAKVLRCKMYVGHGLPGLYTPYRLPFRAAACIVSGHTVDDTNPAVP